jgi:hypothetical protein
MKKMMKSQLKGLPQQQQDMIIGAIETNPDFFTKIAKEIKTKTKAGMDQQTASMQVMLAHKNELQKIMMQNQK